MLAQMQVDSMVAGYSWLFADPLFNIAKFLLGFICVCMDSWLLVHIFYVFRPKLLPNFSFSFDEGVTTKLVNNTEHGQSSFVDADREEIIELAAETHNKNNP